MKYKYVLRCVLNRSYIYIYNLTVIWASTSYGEFSFSLTILLYCLVTCQETEGDMSVFLSVSINVNVTDNDHAEPC